MTDEPAVLTGSNFYRAWNWTPPFWMGCYHTELRACAVRKNGILPETLRDIPGARRLAILAVCALEWRSAIADTIVETHDRIVGKTWREAKSRCDARVADVKSTLSETLRSFRNLGAGLLEAKGDNTSLDVATETSCGWHQLEGLVASAAQLTDTLAADLLAHVVHGYHRFRRYGPRMLRALDIRAAPVAEPLLDAARIIEGTDKTATRSLAFLRQNSKWYRHLNTAGDNEPRLWEVAVLCPLREAFRSGDVWLAHSRRYGDLKDALVPPEVTCATLKLAMPLEPEDWFADRKARLADGLQRLARAAKTGAIPGGSIENGALKIDRLISAVPAEAVALVLDLYGRLPDVRITDLLQEVDIDIGFTEAFTHLRTGIPCKDRIGVLNVLLAEGLNLGLSKMADATNTHDYFPLSRLHPRPLKTESLTVMQFYSGQPDNLAASVRDYCTGVLSFHGEMSKFDTQKLMSVTENYERPQLAAMVLMGRETPELPADVLFSDIEIMALADLATDQKLPQPAGVAITNEH